MREAMRMAAARRARERGGAPSGAAREIAVGLDLVRRRRRRLLATEGVLFFTLVAAALSIALLALDNSLRPGTLVRCALSLGALAALGWLFASRVLRRPLRPIDDEACALLVERERPEFTETLINAVSFARRPERGWRARVVRLVEESAVAGLRGAPRRSLLPARGLARLAGVTALAFGAFVLYGVLLPEHFRNAAARLAFPWREIAPLSRTRLRVTPGHAEILRGASLRVEVETLGPLPEEARIETDGGLEARMEFDGRGFVHLFEAPQRDFSYRVRAGDAASATFRVRVKQPPEVAELSATVWSPAYTGRPPRESKRTSGNLEVLAGSEVRLEVVPTTPVASGALVFARASRVDLAPFAGGRLEARFAVERTLEYAIDLVGVDGTPSPAGAPRRRITALEDGPPECEWIQPARDVELGEGGGGLVVTFRASDDVALAEARLFWAVGAAGGGGEGEGGGGGAAVDTGSRSGGGGSSAAAGTDSARVLERWEFSPREEEAVPSARLDLERLRSVLGAARAGEGERPETSSLVLRVRVSDRRGAATLSEPRRVRWISRREAEERRARQRERLRSDLGEILQRERALEKSIEPLAKAPSQSAVPAGARRLASDQDSIRREGLAVVARWGEGWLSGSTRESRRLADAAIREGMPVVARQLERSGAAERSERKGPLERAGAAAREVIALLERALSGIGSDARSEEGAGTESPEGGRAPSRARRAEEKLEELARELSRFARSQKAVLARTRRLSGVEPEDFTAEEKEALEELAGEEEKWGKRLEELGTDLSKVTPQDMSLSSLAEEVVEIVEELDLARSALEKRNVELAVPAEQSGVQLAEELETNIERWLAREPDHFKWVMEEPLEDFDVPLADLPSELEDIVGELIDQEEQMTAETEDITSSWLDSMDDGIGWDAMDGPISDMSAKGVTGNLQPNDMEIGGRSGEGRSGKSQGQFVEESAQGKGGRQTPTRSTPDPFEGGEVRDESRDPTGGSTGGGKLAGVGEQGLRGAPSPELQRRMRSLSARQAKIRLRGEKVSVALRRRRYYPRNLERALELMRRMEAALAAGRPYRYEPLRQRIHQELGATRDVIASQRDVRYERAPGVPADLEKELANGAGEEIPEEYGDLIRAYYRSLVLSGARSGGGGSPADAKEARK